MIKKIAFIFSLTCFSCMISQAYAQDCPDKPEWHFTDNEECWIFTNNLSGEVSLHRIRICDLQGRIIQDVFPGAMERFTVNANGWTRGFYIVEIETNLGRALKKLILH